VRGARMEPSSPIGPCERDEHKPAVSGSQCHLFVTENLERLNFCDPARRKITGAYRREDQ